MRTWVTLSVLALAIGMTGCKKKSPPPLVHVPPPESGHSDAFIEMSSQPVTVADPVTYAEPSPPPRPVSAPSQYTIRRGDTLWSIAQRVYHDGQRWREILAANPGLQPTKMRVGQVIVLP